MFRLVRRVLLLGIASFLLAAGIYAYTDSFDRRWRGFVQQELQAHGVFLDFDRLTVNPFGGLVVKEVRLFNDNTRQHVIAAVDRLNLDVDFAKLLEGQVVIESLELSHTGVALPVDPERPELTVVELKDLNARAFLNGDQLEIRQAEGDLQGLRISITGVLTLPKKDEDPNKPSKSAMERLSMMREHRAQVQNGLDWLARFRSNTLPELTVNVSGDLNLPQELRGTLSFRAVNLKFEDYVWKELIADAEYDGGMIDVKRLHLSDHLGTLEATAAWRLGSERARFQLTSSADIPSLARAFLDNDGLREVVFYDEAPQLSLEGFWYPKRGRNADGTASFPAEVTGRIDCKRFGSRGAVFNGLSASIGVSTDGFYVRDMVLTHKTGTILMQLMQHREHGVKYDATLRMDPNVLLPFVLREKTRDVIRRFQFDEKSEIDVHVAGEGPSFVLQDGVNSGHGLLKNFRYNGVELESMEADMSFQGFMQAYQNIKIHHARGPAQAEHVYLNDEEKWVRLTNVKAESDTAELVRCFAPKTAAFIERYRLTHGTHVTLNGTIGIQNSKYSDFAFTFRSSDGNGHYMLWGEDYLIQAPHGDLRIVGQKLAYDVKGRLFELPLHAQGTVDLAPGVEDYTADVTAGVFPYEVFGKKLNFADMHAKVSGKSGKVSFDVKAEVLGGGMTLIGTLDETREPNPYQGELRMNALSFKRFAQTYSKGNDSEGDLTGDFKFTGRMNDWSALKGNGVLIIVNGNLLAVPILGPLTPLLGAILPRPIAGYNIAKEADCTFSVEDGFLTTRNLKALSTSFRINSKGRINFIKDDIDFDAEVSVRGLTGLVLFPVTQLLAYRGSGTVTDTKWSPRILSGGKSAVPADTPPPQTPTKRKSLFGN